MPLADFQTELRQWIVDNTTFSNETLFVKDVFQVDFYDRLKEKVSDEKLLPAVLAACQMLNYTELDAAQLGFDQLSQDVVEWCQAKFLWQYLNKKHELLPEVRQNLLSYLQEVIQVNFSLEDRRNFSGNLAWCLMTAVGFEWSLVKGYRTIIQPLCEALTDYVQEKLEELKRKFDFSREAQLALYYELSAVFSKDQAKQVVFNYLKSQLPISALALVELENLSLTLFSSQQVDDLVSYPIKFSLLDSIANRKFEDLIEKLSDDKIYDLRSYVSRQSVQESTYYGDDFLYEKLLEMIPKENQGQDSLMYLLRAYMLATNSPELFYNELNHNTPGMNKLLPRLDSNQLRQAALYYLYYGYHSFFDANFSTLVKHKQQYQPCAQALRQHGINPYEFLILTSVENRGVFFFWLAWMKQSSNEQAKLLTGFLELDYHILSFALTRFMPELPSLESNKQITRFESAITDPRVRITLGLFDEKADDVKQLRAKPFSH